MTAAPATIATARRARLPRRSRRVARARRGAVARARAADLEVAAWTVRRAPDVRPPGAARRDRDLRRGRRARRLSVARRGARRATRRGSVRDGRLSSAVAESERADLVVVGAGTIGGWASWFAKRDGAGGSSSSSAGLAGQGASSRAAGIVRAQGGTPTTVALGRWSIDFYRRQAASSAPTAASASSAT